MVGVTKGYGVLVDSDGEGWWALSLETSNGRGGGCKCDEGVLVDSDGEGAVSLEMSNGLLYQTLYQ